MFVIVAEFRTAPGQAEAFGQLVDRQARDSVELEPGCLSFDVSQDEADPERFLLYEIYSSPEAYGAHRQYPHSNAFQAAIAPLVIERAVRRLNRREKAA